MQEMAELEEDPAQREAAEGEFAEIVSTGEKVAADLRMQSLLSGRMDACTLKDKFGEFEEEGALHFE